MTHVVEWLDQTWAFELDFLQPPHSIERQVYFPMSCPIYDPTSSRNNNPRHADVQRLTEYKTSRISSSDPVTYSLDLMNRKHTFNELNLALLYRHFRRKADTCPMHNIYGVSLYVLYHDKLLHLFSFIRNPCDDYTPITAPSLIIQVTNRPPTVFVTIHTVPTRHHMLTLYNVNHFPTFSTSRYLYNPYNATSH